MKYFYRTEPSFHFSSSLSKKYSWCIPGGMMSSSFPAEKRLSSLSDKHKPGASAYGLPPASRFMFAALFNGSGCPPDPNETLA
jgi:hypothetical protein